MCRGRGSGQACLSGWAGPFMQGEQGDVMLWCQTGGALESQDDPMLLSRKNGIASHSCPQPKGRHQKPVLMFFPSEGRRGFKLYEQRHWIHHCWYVTHKAWGLSAVDRET